jgi:hypothetical protein
LKHLRNDWREKILGKVTRDIEPITLVSDPANLLGDTEIQSILEKQDYITYKYTDHILFRYNFETRYRRLIDNNGKLLIVSEAPEANLRLETPYDLYKKSHVVHVSLNELFPTLEYQSLKEVSISQIDRLYAAYQNHNRVPMGRKLTQEFLLQTLYGIDQKSILTQTDYVVELSLKELPDNLYDYLNFELAKKRNKPTTFFKKRKELYEFLQNKWKQTVQSQGAPSISDYQRLRPVIIKGLLKGDITPIEVTDIESYPLWMRSGLLDGSKTLLTQEITSLLERLEYTLNSDETPQRLWRKVAALWAQTWVKIIQSDSIPEPIQNRVKSLDNRIDSGFSSWVLENHQSLFLIRERKPVTLSQISGHIQRNYPSSKIAVLVIDGMAIDQWIKLKQSIELEKKDLFTFQESFVYAAIPTITSVSRQTIASGTSPSFFGSESQAFNKEKSMWISNWERKGKSADFLKGLKLMENAELSKVKDLASKDALLLISTYLDDQLHDAVNGKHQIHSDIDYWIREGILPELLQLLNREEYIVFVTSDHGNLESQGFGTLRQRLLSEKEGSRVRIYKERVFAEQGKENYPESILYPDKPEQSHYFLFAPGRKSFKRSAEKSVSHGGLSIEEVVVPFIKVGVNK